MEQNGWNQGNEMANGLSSDYEAPSGLSSDYEAPSGLNSDYEAPSMQTNRSAGSGAQSVRYEPDAGFFAQLPFSFLPPKYRVLARAKTGSMICFIILMFFVFTFAVYLKFVMTFDLGKIMKQTLDAFPDFRLRNGEFKIAEDFLIDEPKEHFYVQVVNDEKYFTIQDAADLQRERGYETIVLISKYNMVIGSERGQYRELKFGDEPSLSIDKDWVLDKFVPMLSVIIALGFLLFFIGRCFWYFFCAMLYMLVSMLLAKAFQKEFDAGTLYRTAVYAKVPMAVVGFAISLLPTTIGVPGIVRIIVTFAFIICAFSYVPEKWDI